MIANQSEQSILLTDDQIRQFIVDGYLVLESDLPRELHQRIYEQLSTSLYEESNPGNNILPRVGAFERILELPEVRGALTGILGKNYLLHPHRFCHPQETMADPGKSALDESYHQDSHSPLSRPHHHYPRYAMLLYYPQDTALEHGPTHLIPGSQYYPRLSQQDIQQGRPVAGQAGSLILIHFDIGHGAGVNLLRRTRFMMKFVFVRSEEPQGPSWNCQETGWQMPAAPEAPHSLESLWSHVWDWMHGRTDRFASIRKGATRHDGLSVSQLIDRLKSSCSLDDRLNACNALAALSAEGAAAITVLLECLSDAHGALRLNAAYALAAMGKVAVDPLLNHLQEIGREKANTSDSPGEWDEGFTPMEEAAHGLAAIGTPAVTALVETLGHDDEWVRINAAFALGEMGCQAETAVESLVSCLDDPSHRVVRTAADALGCIRRNAAVAVPALCRLLREDHPRWRQSLRRDWNGQDQARVNAAMALCRFDRDAASAEETLLQALHDPCGYVNLFALHALRRIDTNRAGEAVFRFLETRCWDPSITRTRMF